MRGEHVRHEAVVERRQVQVRPEAEERRLPVGEHRAQPVDARSGEDDAHAVAATVQARPQRGDEAPVRLGRQLLHLVEHRQRGLPRAGGQTLDQVVEPRQMVRGRLVRPSCEVDLAADPGRRDPQLRTRGPDRVRRSRPQARLLRARADRVLEHARRIVVGLPDAGMDNPQPALGRERSEVAQEELGLAPPPRREHGDGRRAATYERVEDRPGEAIARVAPDDLRHASPNGGSSTTRRTASKIW